MADLNCPFDIIPFAASSPIANVNIFSLNYTNQDFWSLKSRQLDYVQQQFGKSFADFVESDLGIMQLELFAFVGDTLSFKTDQVANEVFIDTVTELDNAFRLAELVGFQPQPPIASRAMFVATLNNILTTDITISAPYLIVLPTTDKPRTMELFPADPSNNPIFNQDITIPAGSLSNSSIIGVEGQTFITNFTGTGAVNQSLALSQSPVLWNSIQVSIDGVNWQQVDFFTDSQPRREFRVEFDSAYDAFIIFGNNRAGLIPSSGSQIQVTYRVGGGAGGNIVTGAINTNTNVLVPGFNFVAGVNLTNYTRGEFGYDGDGIDDIRRKLPAYLRTQNRAVTGLDYKTLADQFATPYSGMIGKSVAALRSYGCSGNVIDLYILALDGTTGLVQASDDLKTALSQMFDSTKMFTDYLCLRDGSVILVDTNIEVVLDRLFKKFQNTINQQVLNAVNSFFSLNNWEYGQTLVDADLIKSLNSIQEISSVNVTFTTANTLTAQSMITANFNEIIRPDVITVGFTYTGQGE